MDSHLSKSTHQSHNYSTIRHVWKLWLSFGLVLFSLRQFLSKIILNCNLYVYSIVYQTVIFYRLFMKIETSRNSGPEIYRRSLWSLPIYFMSLFTIPVSTVRSLEKIMRDFLWPNNGVTKGLHWVNWGEVCRPKHQGGLGIRPLYQMNAALLIKWI